MLAETDEYVNQRVFYNASVCKYFALYLFEPELAGLAGLEESRLKEAQSNRMCYSNIRHIASLE